LEREGFTVWVDEARLSPSVRWWKTIEENIESSAALIVVMSPDAVESDWVEREILLAENLKRPIYPVLLAGAPWSRLANIQFEDMRAGLHTHLTPAFIQSLRHKVPGREAGKPAITFSVQEGDISDFPADVLAFKYAHGFYGADMFIAQLLVMSKDSSFNLEMPMPKEGEHLLTPASEIMPAQHILFVGTPILRHLGYKQIQKFAADVLVALAADAPTTRHLAMTIHGPGFGLDEIEAMFSQLAGYQDAIQSGQIPPALERITIIEQSPNRTQRLRAALESHFAKDGQVAPPPDRWEYVLAAPSPAQAPAAVVEEEPHKPHAYVIMPAQADMDDIFYYGVQSPIHAHGLLCEHLEHNDMTADLLDTVRQRIASANVTVIDVTYLNPLVYLQLGYAWGKGCPTLILARQNAVLDDWLASTVMIRYERIKDLEQNLSSALDRLKSEGKL
ncbi:MAG: toll/interleukin-1 receptor domain-containing protein, partial [Anaerolineae bacterium]|nr:toll/interleukin-1 receptor domain-containing protein [Anaerolineae bacterium]